jgi:hypothetical protein
MKNKFKFAMTLAVILAMLLTSLALADVMNNDATSAGLNTITAGDSTTITYQLVGNSAPSGDPSGCDATTTNPVTVAITKPAAVSGPASLNFTGCGNPNKVQITFSSSTPGSYSISHAISGGVSGSQFNNNADFTLTVNAATPTNQDPSLSLPADITTEATSGAGAAVTFNATASDPEDGALTPSCEPTSGSTFPLGTTQVDCSVEDSGGLTASGFFNVTVVDTTEPELTLANVTAEATGPAGAAVAFSASANDIVDGQVAVLCDANSGDTFPLGVTTVDCSAEDAAGNIAHGSFTVTVQDTTPPALSLPANIVQEATGPAGNSITYAASATDTVDGSAAVICTPASGSTFAIATTTVNCSATDSSGNSATGSFTVKVQDTTPPSVSVPANITVEATGPSGAVVSFSASADDIVDGAMTPACSPASGSIFPLGTTTVNCSATDTAGNTGSASFSVSVVDTTPPALTLPGNMTVPATSSAGAVVTFSATANDIVDGAVAVSCTPASGSTFAPGTTTINCSATDAHSNTASGSFTISVTFQLSGFYQPVDMTTGPTIVWNTVRNGSTVPLKFELFAGSTELTNTSYVVQPLRAVGVACGTGTADDIELTATGGTSLRYDTTGGQFIYNWQTPRIAGACYKVTVSFIDGSSLSAYFKLK